MAEQDATRKPGQTFEQWWNRNGQDWQHSQVEYLLAQSAWYARDQGIAQLTAERDQFQLLFEDAFRRLKEVMPNAAHSAGKTIPQLVVTGDSPSGKRDCAEEIARVRQQTIDLRQCLRNGLAMCELSSAPDFDSWMMQARALAKEEAPPK